MCNPLSRISNSFPLSGNSFPRVRQYVLSNCNSFPRIGQLDLSDYNSFPPIRQSVRSNCNSFPGIGQLMDQFDRTDGLIQGNDLLIRWNELSNSRERVAIRENGLFCSRERRTSCLIRGNELLIHGNEFIIRGNEYLIRENRLHNSI